MGYTKDMLLGRTERLLRHLKLSGHEQPIDCRQDAYTAALELMMAMGSAESTLNIADGIMTRAAHHQMSILDALYEERDYIDELVNADTQVRS